MSLRVIGAGVGRTGTSSLKLALQRLLGGPCYHMREVFAQTEHVRIWHRATQNHIPDWHTFFTDYHATVDWPAAAFWQELSVAFPEAIILLSVRNPVSWWQSAHETIFQATKSTVDSEWYTMFNALLAARFTNNLDNREACIAAFERHNMLVRQNAPSHRLLEWQTDDGWNPLCKALGVPIPDEPFPHTNTRREWHEGHTSD
ncbi:MAG: sulfotransferase family protein [Chloroflexi bacterium AL-W]|nr:sulfotransferase family protein [Chloroflexi bacterium AL-N1]NOK66453.1 sulfotransferase family protein [Chloroflexi bacterium AL-N10]NOK71841.1 sulfotransferase family protein [Chloroflexi bacterium AL-N5]NOK81098.1 sulfotransferase family protein [Chloroflexi bacterium AL-W]NOK89371.1 sulfotransferase family protein [Chloroflexi bacterium AL-N15]